MNTGLDIVVFSLYIPSFSFMGEAMKGAGGLPRSPMMRAARYHFTQFIMRFKQPDPTPRPGAPVLDLGRAEPASSEVARIERRFYDKAAQQDKAIYDLRLKLEAACKDITRLQVEVANLKTLK